MFFKNFVVSDSTNKHLSIKRNKSKEPTGERGEISVETTKNKTGSFQEYDAFNFLDDFVLNMLTEHKKLLPREIIRRVQDKISVSESTINTCLFFLYVNGLISNQCVGTKKFYKITEEGNQFLREFDQIKNKLLESRNSPKQLNRLSKKKAIINF